MKNVVNINQFELDHKDLKSISNFWAEKLKTYGEKSIVHFDVESNGCPTCGPDAELDIWIEIIGDQK